MKAVKPCSRMPAVLALALILGAAIPEAGVQAGQRPYSRSQYRWAVNWINGPLETLMANGVIETVSTRGGSFQVQAGDAWSGLSFKQAGEILKNISRARQITGHSPFFTVTRQETETVLGRVTGSSITVLVPGEGYIEYFPDTSDRDSTVY